MRSKTAATLAVTAVVLAGGLVWWATRDSPPAQPPDPRLTSSSPYRNVRPDVKYVGDEACAACHRDVADTYRHHPMGRSLAPVADVADRDRYEEAVHNPFRQFNTDYAIRREAGKVFHRAERKGADGRLLFEVEAEAAYAIGSGTRGRTYLVERDGHLFQSPISWYAQKQIWDLAPGYTGDRLFDRPIRPECLFCHANDARPIPDSLGAYRRPTFTQHAIGCERCHGPGELHVARMSAPGDTPPGKDLTIVNPKDLEPGLREAVCQQCHLQGQTQILRRGREAFDFRPGLPLHDFWAIYVRIPKLSEESKAVGHVEQMHASRCFRASGGKLGCISCHDPHAVPEEGKRVAFYRDRCLTCHGEQACRLAPEARRRTQPDDSCAACHMPRRSSTDIVHTAVTDHRVPRKPDAGPARATPPPPLEPGELPIRPFHPELADPGDVAASRDMGLALLNVVREIPQTARFLAPAIETRLEAAMKDDPGDAAGREGLAYSRWAQGRWEKALAEYEQLLKDHPRRETALYDACVLANQFGRAEAAVGYGRRLVVVNPWNAASHQHLARALASANRWREAAASCRETLRLNPNRPEARQLLIRSLLRAGDRSGAEAELATLVDLEPARADELRRWFAEQAR